MPARASRVVVVKDKDGWCHTCRHTKLIIPRQWDLVNLASTPTWPSDCRCIDWGTNYVTCIVNESASSPCGGSFVILAADCAHTDLTPLSTILTLPSCILRWLAYRFYLVNPIGLLIISLGRFNFYRRAQGKSFKKAPRQA